MKQAFNKNNLITIILVGISAISITVTGIIFGQSPLRIAPLYVSLIVGLMQTKVNRYAPLIGGLNSLLYGFAYFHYHLYGQCLSALFFSFPLQIITFIRWTKYKRGNTTKLTRLSNRFRLAIIPAYAICVFAMSYLLPKIGANYAFFDSATTLLGILVTFLTLFACIEYAPLMLINVALTVYLYISMLGEHPEQITYLIYSLYTFICTCFTLLRVMKIYKEQSAQESKTQKLAV